MDLAILRIGWVVLLNSLTDLTKKLYQCQASTVGHEQQQVD